MVHFNLINLFTKCFNQDDSYVDVILVIVVPQRWSTPSTMTIDRGVEIYESISHPDQSETLVM